MARPRKEGMEYFSHDTASISDEKLDLLVTQFGANGYAFFFLHLEYIYRSEDLSVDVSGPVFRKLICAKFKITPEEYDEILNATLEIGLFDAERFKETGKLFSNGVKRRVDAFRDERENARERKQRSREKARDNTEQADTSQHVTDCHELSQEVTPKKEKEKEKEKEKDIEDAYASSCAETPQAATTAPAPAVPPCPHQKIIALYHEILPACPHVKVWPEQSRKQLADRWREDNARQSLDWWQGVFADVAASDFLMGRKGERSFTFSLTWFVKPANFAKVLNGNYANRASPQQQPQQPQYPQRLSPNQAYMLEAARYLKGQGYGKIEQPNDTPRNETPPRALPGSGA